MLNFSEKNISPSTLSNNSSSLSSLKNNYSSSSHLHSSVSIEQFANSVFSLAARYMKNAGLDELVSIKSTFLDWKSKRNGNCEQIHSYAKWRSLFAQHVFMTQFKAIDSTFSQLLNLKSIKSVLKNIYNVTCIGCGPGASVVAALLLDKELSDDANNVDASINRKQENSMRHLTITAMDQYHGWAPFVRSLASHVNQHTTTLDFEQLEQSESGCMTNSHLMRSGGGGEADLCIITRSQCNEFSVLFWTLLVTKFKLVLVLMDPGDVGWHPDSKFSQMLCRTLNFQPGIPLGGASSSGYRFLYHLQQQLAQDDDAIGHPSLPLVSSQELREMCKETFVTSDQLVLTALQMLIDQKTRAGGAVEGDAISLSSSKTMTLPTRTILNSNAAVSSLIKSSNQQQQMIGAALAASGMRHNQLASSSSSPSAASFDVSSNKRTVFDRLGGKKVTTIENSPSSFCSSNQLLGTTYVPQSKHYQSLTNQNQQQQQEQLILILNNLNNATASANAGLNRKNDGASSALANQMATNQQQLHQQFASAQQPVVQMHHDLPHSQKLVSSTKGVGRAGSSSNEMAVEQLLMTTLLNSQSFAAAGGGGSGATDLTNSIMNQLMKPPPPIPLVNQSAGAPPVSGAAAISLPPQYQQTAATSSSSQHAAASLHSNPSSTSQQQQQTSILMNLLNTLTSGGGESATPDLASLALSLLNNQSDLQSSQSTLSVVAPSLTSYISPLLPLPQPPSQQPQQMSSSIQSTAAAITEYPPTNQNDLSSVTPLIDCSQSFLAFPAAAATSIPSLPVSPRNHTHSQSLRYSSPSHSCSSSVSSSGNSRNHHHRSHQEHHHRGKNHQQHANQSSKKLRRHHDITSFRNAFPPPPQQKSLSLQGGSQHFPRSPSNFHFKASFTTSQTATSSKMTAVAAGGGGVRSPAYKCRRRYNRGAGRYDDIDSSQSGSLSSRSNSPSSPTPHSSSSFQQSRSTHHHHQVSTRHHSVAMAPLLPLPTHSARSPLLPLDSIILKQHRSELGGKTTAVTSTAADYSSSSRRHCSSSRDSSASKSSTHNMRGSKRDQVSSINSAIVGGGGTKGSRRRSRSPNRGYRKVDVKLAKSSKTVDQHEHKSNKPRARNYSRS